MPDTKLAELLCTRLCHDLTGPIGAVNNGVEFLQEEDGAMQGDAMDLILSSATEAVNRLQFYRQAYGRLNDGGEAPLNEKRETVQLFFSTSKIKLDWPDSHAQGASISISQKMARLMLNLFIVAAGALIKGGSIAVRLNILEDGSKQITLSCLGDIVKIDPDHVRILTGDANVGEMSPKTAQLVLTRTYAQEIAADLQIQVQDGQMVMAIHQAPAATPGDAAGTQATA